MALQPVLFLLLLWDLTSLVPGVTSSCNITCSTDYETSLNCSCAGSVPTYSLLVNVKCRSEGDEVNGSCEVKAPQSWCVMYPEMFLDVASIGTVCTTTVSQRSGSEILSTTESPPWHLSNVVKLQPPFNVQMTNSEGFYNITWGHSDQDDSIQYTVRIRESKDSQDPIHSLLVEGKHIRLDHKTLQPCVNYTLDVKARYRPETVYEGPWSEWSSTAELTTICYPVVHYPIFNNWWCILLSIIPILGVVLGLKNKTYLQKKIHLITYIPKPDEFFNPLYHNYGGNFKDWVHPVFNEYDYLKINTQVQMRMERQHDILQWKNEKQNYSEDNDMRQDGHLLHVPQPHSNSLLFFRNAGSSHSTGHISIHTVTLSGEDEYAEEVMSHRSYQDGESFDGDNREQAGYNMEGPQMFEFDRQSGILPRLENQISDDSSVEDINFQPGAQLEPERVSLDSFASHEQSEDGYPRVDLDTIDSGFGECSSPAASDSNIAEQIHSFHEDKNSNSNYVKQWMVCSTLQQDSRDLENELHETQ